MEQLIELLKQIQELAGVGIDALDAATKGGKPGGGPPEGKPEGGPPPEHEGPPGPGGPGGRPGGPGQGAPPEGERR